MELKGAIFDMDGTLIDSLFLWEVIWKEFGKRYLKGKDFKPTEADDKVVRTITLKDAMELIHNNYRLGDSGAELLEIANEIMVEFYRNEVLLKKGVLEFLEGCYKKGVKICIASATAPDLLQLAIEHLGVSKYFLKVISCATKGIGKEKPDIFLEALELLGTQKEETYVFEDSLVALKTAREAGFKTVGIYDKHNLQYQEEIKKIVTFYVSSEMTLANLL